MPIGLRVLTAIEFAVYESLATVSRWFSDDGGYGGRDPLADRTEIRRGGVFSGQGPET